MILIFFLCYIVFDFVFYFRHNIGVLNIIINYKGKYKFFIVK